MRRLLGLRTRGLFALFLRLLGFLGGFFVVIIAIGYHRPHHRACAFNGDFAGLHDCGGS